MNQKRQTVKLCIVMFGVVFLCRSLIFIQTSNRTKDERTNFTATIGMDSTKEPQVFACPHRLAVAWDDGRFGNKFFQYLAARLVTSVLKHDIFITKAFGEIYDSYFDGRQAPIIDWDFMEHKCGFTESECTKLNINEFGQLKPVSKYKCIVFQGFPVLITARQWQAIYSQRNKLLEEFQWKPELKLSVDLKLKEVKSQYNTSTAVAVHVRRTDYSSYVIGYYKTFSPANASYYYKAMNYFRGKYQNPVFLVFSDDMEWCRENLSGPDVVFTGNGNHSDPGQDLALMSSCNHIILSYGTFGMAAAWFNKHGEIIAADKFTGKPEIMVEALKKIPNLKWIWMSVR